MGGGQKGAWGSAEETAREVKAVFVLKQSPLVDPPLGAGLPRPCGGGSQLITVRWAVRGT